MRLCKLYIWIGLHEVHALYLVVEREGRSPKGSLLKIASMLRWHIHPCSCFHIGLLSERCFGQVN